MKTLMLLLLVAAAAQAEDTATIWVRLNYYDVEDKTTHYYFGRVDKALIDKLDNGTMPSFVKLEDACWFEYDEKDSDQLTGIDTNAKHDNSATVYLATRKIDEIIPLQMPPAEYLKQQNGPEAPAGAKGSLP
jgi:hypothetical protein